MKKKILIPILIGVIAIILYGCSKPNGTSIASPEISESEVQHNCLMYLIYPDSFYVWGLTEECDCDVIVIPEKYRGKPIEMVEAWAFAGRSHIGMVYIPISVLSIGESAFNGCSGLSAIDLSSGLKDIESMAFAGCTNLTSVTIPETVCSIGDFAFYGCSELTQATFEGDVSELGINIFEECINLKKVYLVKGTNTEKWILSNLPEIEIVYIKT